jgi:PAS domain S-box-containing protein
MRYGNPSDQCRNLYRFIRLVLGEEISDREIARRWGLDEKNLRELKQGKRVVPKLSRLVDLARALGVHKYYVLEVASGIPAETIYRVYRNNLLERDLLELDNAFHGIVPDKREKERILAALQTAALAAHRTLEPERIFPQVSRVLKKFDFESHTFFLHPETQSASIRHSSFSPRLLHAAESVSGLSLSSFRFPLNRVPPFQTVVDARHPLFLPDASVLLNQILGERHLMRFVQRMKKMFRILEVVLTPILFQGEVLGVFAAGMGGRLNEACLPEMRRFSEHLSCSFENAVLFQHVKRSETRLRDLLHKLPEGVFQCDGQGRIEQINAAGADMLGFSGADEPIGRSIREFRLLNPEAKAVRRQTRKSKKTSVQNIVGMAEKQDGSPFLADVTVRTEYDRKGAVESTEGVFRDISRTTPL